MHGCCTHNDSTALSLTPPPPPRAGAVCYRAAVVKSRPFVSNKYHHPCTKRGVAFFHEFRVAASGRSHYSADPHKAYFDFLDTLQFCISEFLLPLRLSRCLWWCATSPSGVAWILLDLTGSRRIGPDPTGTCERSRGGVSLPGTTYCDR